MKRITLFAGLLLLAVSTLLTGSPVRANEGCGLRPLKPLRPLGCKDLVAECVCDSDGEHCRWEWRCVK